jgi:hypothetical protein
MIIVIRFNPHLIIERMAGFEAGKALVERKESFANSLGGYERGGFSARRV